MPECQESGFRLIKRCIERETTSNRIVEDRYVNEGCSLFQGTLEEFKSDPKHQIGQFAEPGTEPTSVFGLLVVMSLLAMIVLWTLNKRKNKILSEIYSKLSIVDR